MSKEILSVLLFVASVMAKGRGGGSGSSGGAIDDNWDAPPELKAAMAFEIIWFIASLLQLYYISKNLKVVPSTARSPYIALTVLTLFNAAMYLLWAIWTRIATEILPTTGNYIRGALIFLFGVDNAFRPGVVLYLIHQRGSVLRTKFTTTAPLLTPVWKRFLDMGLVGIAFVFCLTATAVFAAEVEYQRTGYIAKYRELLLVYRGLSHTSVAFIMLLAINVIATLIFFYAYSKKTNSGDLVSEKAKSGDLVITRLLLIVAPFIAIFALETMVMQILVYTPRRDWDTLAANLSEVIIEGTCRASITAGIILTMTLPVEWTTEQTGPAVAYTTVPVYGQQWSTPNSGWSKPLYPQQPTQQSAQPSFYPQPHPLYQQVQQNSYPAPTHLPPP